MSKQYLEIKPSIKKLGLLQKPFDILLDLHHPLLTRYLKEAAQAGYNLGFHLRVYTVKAITDLQWCNFIGRLQDYYWYSQKRHT